MSPTATLPPETAEVSASLRETRSFEVSRETPRAARAWIEQQARDAGVDEKTRFRLGTACAEALSNACRHAYRDLEPGPVHVTVEADAAELAVTVRDEGHGFDPAVCAPPRSTDLAEGGYGLSLMDRLVDRFTLSARPGQGTEARLAVRLPAQADAAET